MTMLTQMSLGFILDVVKGLFFQSALVTVARGRVSTDMISEVLTMRWHCLAVRLCSSCALRGVSHGHAGRLARGSGWVSTGLQCRADPNPVFAAPLGCWLC